MSNINTIHCGDNRVILTEYSDNFFDAFLEDVPYGLFGKDIPINEILQAFDNGQSYKKGKGFMGREWDGFILGTDFTQIRYDKLKPGGYIFMFCSPITIGLFQVALWKVGFEMITTFVWNYGSDFNKSKHRVKELTEFIIVAQKPIEKGLTIEQNIEKWGCGGLNIDEGRIGTTGGTKDSFSSSENNKRIGHNYGDRKKGTSHKLKKGRVPSNVILSHTEHCVCYGEKKVKTQPCGIKLGHVRKNKSVYGMHDKPVAKKDKYADENNLETIEDWDCIDGCPVKEMSLAGGVRVTNSNGDVATVARYFYNAKTSPNERHAGCQDLLWQIDDNSPVGYSLVDAQKWLKLPDNQKRRGNIHPTVKPINLGQIFARLIISKKDGHIPIVCDGFCGSGGLLVGLMYEGLNYVGIELNPEYYKIANTRMEYAKSLLERGKHINDIKVKMKTPKIGERLF